MKHRIKTSEELDALSDVELIDEWLEVQGQPDNEEFNNYRVELSHRIAEAGISLNEVTSIQDGEFGGS